MAATSHLATTAACTLQSHTAPTHTSPHPAVNKSHVCCLSVSLSPCLLAPPIGVTSVVMHYHCTGSCPVTPPSTYNSRQGRTHQSLLVTTPHDRALSSLCQRAPSVPCASTEHSLYLQARTQHPASNAGLRMRTSAEAMHAAAQAGALARACATLPQKSLCGCSVIPSSKNNCHKPITGGQRWASPGQPPCSQQPPCASHSSS